MMKTAVIDIGSNSVRLCIFADGIIMLKQKIITRLAEGLVFGKTLEKAATFRTLAAIKTFYATALGQGVSDKNIYAFATAALRNASDGKAFISSVFDETGVKIDLLSEEEEGLAALSGALGSADGAVLDIGGASSELIVKKEGKIVYFKSLHLGAVVLNERCGEDYSRTASYITRKLKDYGEIPPLKKVYAVGGTATSCAYVLSGYKKYLEERVHLRVIKQEKVEMLSKTLFAMTEEERASLYALEPQRAKIIASGALLLAKIMAYAKIKELTVSENDNLLGYYRLKFGEDT